MNLRYCLSSILLLVLINCSGQQHLSGIRINQVGYYTLAPKIAAVVGASSSAEFVVKDAKSGKVVFTGRLSDIKQSQNSLLQTRIADFSSLQKPGNYNISVPGTTDSYTFSIREDMHHDVVVSSIRGYYYQRISMPLEEKFAGKWKRPAGHPDTTVLIHASAASAQRPAGTIVASAGGWYDAGDYNKYIVNSGITMGTLLSAYEDFSKYFDTLHLNIPESNDQTPDLLDEIAYNLRWMLTMQDPNDGGVYHKCTNASFDGMVMPGVTTAPRYMVQKSTAAALDFAAVMAQAWRVYGNFDPQFLPLADSCIKAAQRAWRWAEQNPSLEYNQDRINRSFDPDITTGAYGDRNLNDEWFWAATELYVSTGHEKYKEVVEQRIHAPLQLHSWSNVQLMGYFTLLRAREKFSSPGAESINLVKRNLLQFANELIKPVSASAFATVMGGRKTDFIWGSSAVAANQSMVLINAYLITRDKKYLHHALSNLDYLLGRNATGYCFVTGIGSKYPMHPHHRPSVADKIDEPVPGLLSGGPNPGMQDKCNYQYKDPELAFVDHDCSYASNEIAINWNAPLVYLAAGMEALGSQF